MNVKDKVIQGHSVEADDGYLGDHYAGNLIGGFNRVGNS